MYFDQFSLIPPLHLGLVVLGIVVLLGGVWVVSIQSGGGGVDVGAWNEESIKLTGEDEALYSEPDDADADNEASEGLTMSDQPNGSHPRPGIGPLAMERETRSEPYLPNITDSTPVGLGIDMGSPDSMAGKPQSSISIPSTRRRADSQLYSSPRTPSRHSKRKPTADVNVSPSSVHHHHGHSRTMSYPHPHVLPSPPLGSVSTLGPGFQIGLSPLSPGFTITPLERRRRPSAMGLGGPSLADVANEVLSNEQGRRRTVSEGGVTRTAVGADEDTSAENNDDVTRDDIHAGNGRKRWKWLRHIFTGND